MQIATPKANPTPDELTEELLSLPDLGAQKRWLYDHTALLDERVAGALKQRADQLLRSNIQNAFGCADLLNYMANLTGNPRFQAIGLLARANAHYIGLGEYKTAITLYDEATEIYDCLGARLEQAKAQIGKIYPLAALGNYHEALATGQEVGEVLETHAEWLALAKLCINLSAVNGRLGEDAKALAHLERAQALLRNQGEAGKQYLAFVEHNRAILLRNLGHFAESIAAAQVAFALQQELNQHSEMARTKQNLATTYFILGRYNESLTLLDEARQIFLSDGRQRDAVLLNLFVCDCLIQLRRFEDVLENCREARRLFTELGAHFEIGQALLNEAIAYVGLDQLQAALNSLVEARQIFAVEGNLAWVATADYETAAVLYRQGRFGECLNIAREAANLFSEHLLPLKQAQAQTLAARAAAALEQHDLAWAWVTEALAISQQRDIPSLLYQLHQLSGEMLAKEGKPTAALAAYDQAINAVERMRGRLMIEFRADFLADKQTVYEDAVGLCLEQQLFDRGLGYVERAKSRALLDLVAYRLDLSLNPRTPEDAALVAQLTELRRERERLYRRWEGNDEFRQRGSTSVEEDQQQSQKDVLLLEKQITDLWHKLLIHNADYARDALHWHVHTESAQPYLAPQTALLEFFSVRGRLTTFLITADDIRPYPLPMTVAKAEQLLRLFGLNLRSIAQARSRQQLAQLSVNAQCILRQLYAGLIEPLAEALAHYPQLTIVPHGSLHYLPFHALLDGNTYLLQRHEISYLPGASFLRFCKQTPATLARMDKQRIFAFGHSQQGKLPFAVDEAQQVAAILAGQPIVEQAATVAKVCEAAQTCDILHLATHAEFRPDNPLFSGLALEDGSLTTLDIFNLRMRASLVTLSACQTGRSVIGGGDELLGLMRAFLYAGASSLVLGLWSVEDRSTSQLMQEFYQSIASGATKGAALRHAQLAVLGQEDYAHPYFWAPFFLVGSRN